MSLTAGTRIGPYEVTARIGEGGMGVVYRARDTRLKREVALKVLPDMFAGDPDRLARFQREAEALASLSHPNIAAIYGLEETNGVRALALELVEGQTVAERIEHVTSHKSQSSSHNGLAIDEALAIARQIADALAAAHEHGIIHRDLKPANVKVTPDGVVKVLDFGLAKALGPPEGGHYVPDLTASPTITSPAMMTGVGVLLGTAAYMAPEQAKGRAADKRADVWAFGCVLYEMLTGRTLFAGEDVSDTLANVLKREPDWSALPADVPPAIRALLRRCLEKERRKRVSDIAAAIFAIDEGAQLAAPSTAPAPLSHRSLLRRTASPITTLIAGAALAAIIVAYFRSPPAEPPEMRLQIVTPPPGDETGAVSFAISPDGRSIVFRAVAEQTTQLWLRTLDSETARPLTGTENASFPFWSPDSQSIGFFADQKLKRMDVAGGAVQTLADAPASSYGATWSSDGVILFSATNTEPLYRIAASGGQRPVEATRIEAPGQIAHRFPHFLPDGRRFLFFATGAPGVQGVFVGSLDSMQAIRLVDADTAAVFVPPDSVLFVRDEVLYAQRVDLEALTPVGEPFRVADAVAQNRGIYASVALSAAASGLFAYRAPAENARELVWVQRQGRQTGTFGTISGLTNDVRPSPDGRTVAVVRTVDGNMDTWLIEAARGVLRRFTFDAANDDNPVWSPDGSRISFHSNRKAGNLYDLYQRALSGDTEEILLKSSENKNMGDWSPDGRFILFAVTKPQTARDIWALPLEGDRKPFVVAQTAFEETNARFSPDGRWIAYQSRETGRDEVFVHPFPGPGRNWQISTNGGTDAQWRGDGREIFYLAPDNRLMAVPVTLNADSVTVAAGNPIPLFPLRPGSTYAAVPDGQRFLINQPTDDAAASPITVVLNWKPRANQE